MGSYQKKLVLKLPTHARGFAMSNEDRADREHVRVWSEASNYYAHRSLILGRVSAGIKLRWKPVKEEQPDEIKIKIVVTAPEDEEPTNANWLLDGMAESLLADMFVTMNLSCPSSFQLYRAKLLDETGGGRFRRLS